MLADMLHVMTAACFDYTTVGWAFVKKLTHIQTCLVLTLDIVSCSNAKDMLLLLHP